MNTVAEPALSKPVINWAKIKPDAQGDLAIVENCVFCGGRHVHGAPIGNSLSNRAPHCGHPFESANLPNYDLATPAWQGLESPEQAGRKKLDATINRFMASRGFPHTGSWLYQFEYRDGISNTPIFEVTGKRNGFSGTPIFDKNRVLVQVIAERRVIEEKAKVFPGHRVIWRASGNHDAPPCPPLVSRQEYDETLDKVHFKTEWFQKSQRCRSSEELNAFLAAESGAEVWTYCRRETARVLAQMREPTSPKPSKAEHQRSPEIAQVQSNRKTPPAPLKTPSERRYDLRTADDLAAQLPAPYRVKGVLLREAMAAIYGQSGSGKTFLALDLANAISDGKSWFGCRIEPCDVIYIVLEGEAGVSQRVKAYRVKYGAETGKRVKFIAAPLSLLYRDDIDVLIATVKDAGIQGGVIFVDTLSAATPGMDENTSADMGEAIAAVKRIREECGGLVILIHHPGKDATKGLRGHSSLYAALDSVIEVTREGDRRTWTLTKSKDGIEGAEHQFRLDVLEVGTDQDGDAITSCVVIPEESTADTVRRAKLPAGGNQRLIWNALGDLLRASTDFGKGGAPAGRPCVALEPAIEKLRDRLTTDPKRRTERTRKAITSLVNRRLLNLNEGWIWIA